MHTSKAFTEENPEILMQIMQDNAFATLITNDTEGRPEATPLPFLIKQQDDEIFLQAHFARVNSQWKHLENNAQVLVVFNGPHAYISPSWYVDSGVPTWDYVTVHAYGTAKLFDDLNKTRSLSENSKRSENPAD